MTPDIRQFLVLDHNQIRQMHENTPGNKFIISKWFLLTDFHERICLKTMICIKTPYINLNPVLFKDTNLDLLLVYYKN